MASQTDPNLIELIRYHNWANAALFAICETLAPDQLAASTPGAYGSIHRTIGHMVYAEADYVGRLTGAQPKPWFDWQAGPSVADLRAFATQVGDSLLKAVQRISPLSNVHEEDGDLAIDYQARLLYYQAIIHGLEHRTNITTTLNALGVHLPELDGWGYLFAHGDRFALKETGPA